MYNLLHFKSLSNCFAPQRMTLNFKFKSRFPPALYLAPWRRLVDTNGFGATVVLHPLVPPRPRRLRTVRRLGKSHHLSFGCFFLQTCLNWMHFFWFPSVFRPRHCMHALQASDSVSRFRIWNIRWGLKFEPHLWLCYAMPYVLMPYFPSPRLSG